MLPALLLASLLAASPKPSSPPARNFALELRDLLSIPYVNDEAVDEGGRWTFFAHPEKTAEAKGLNCSGFVLSAARRLLGLKLTLAEASRDRLGDSGDGSPLGKDWDFGWDLVMNLSEGLPRQVVMPDGAEPIASGADGRTMRGFSINDEKAWNKVFARLRSDRVYLASMSRANKRLEHHHVALLLKDAAGRTWFYQTLPKGGSHRLDLTSEHGYTRMQGMFKGPGIKILLVEVEPPASADAGPALPAMKQVSAACAASGEPQPRCSKDTHRKPVPKCEKCPDDRPGPRPEYRAVCLSGGCQARTTGAQEKASPVHRVVELDPSFCTGDSDCRLSSFDCSECGRCPDSPPLAITSKQEAAAKEECRRHPPARLDPRHLRTPPACSPCQGSITDDIPQYKAVCESGRCEPKTAGTLPRSRLGPGDSPRK